MTRASPMLLAVTVAAACTGGQRLPSAPHGEPVIEVRGAIKGGPYRLGETDLAALPRRELRGVDPTTGRESRWEGPDLASLVKRVELSRGADTVIVHTQDRMAIPIPITMIRQLRPVLADHAEGAPFAGRLLAWPSAEQRGLASDPRAALWWARGVTSLELVNGQRTYGRALFVPEAALEGARLGEEIFESRCVACHRVRKMGGQKGPDLTRAADRLKLEPLRALLENHPGWNQRGLEPLAEEAPTQVLAFLRSVSAYAASGAPGGAGGERGGEEELEDESRPPPPGRY